jgi:hypothetical protein
MLGRSDCATFNFIQDVDGESFCRLSRELESRAPHVYSIDIGGSTTDSDVCLKISSAFGSARFTRWGGVIDSIEDLSYRQDSFILLMWGAQHLAPQLMFSVIEMLSHSTYFWIKKDKPIHHVFLFCDLPRMHDDR